MGTFSKTLASSPVASTYAGFPPDMDDWSCAQWKTYYQNNVKALGKDRALQIVDVDSENVGMFATVHSCLYDCEWVKYFKAEGLSASNIFSTLYCGASNIATSAVNTAVNSAGVIENVTGAAKSFSGSKLLIGGAILLAGFGIYKIVTSDNAKNNLKYLV
jgi:hypothetical protein